MKTKIPPLFAVLTLLGMGLVLLTRIVRPGLGDPLPAVGFIFGVLPNFGAGLGLPSVLTILAIWNQHKFKRAYPLRTVVLTCSLISLVGLSAWEFTGGTIDKYDLLASLAAILISLGLLLLITRKPIKEAAHEN